MGTIVDGPEDGVGASVRSRFPGAREVVGGLADNHSGRDVARMAGALARELGASVTLVQVIPKGTPERRRALLESSALTVALEGVRGRPRIQVTFEYSSGDPGRVLVARSRDSLGLVVGEGHFEALGRAGRVAQFCRRHATCPVHAVPLPPDVPDLPDHTGLPGETVTTESGATALGTPAVGRGSMPGGRDQRP